MRYAVLVAVLCIGCQDKVALDAKEKEITALKAQLASQTAATPLKPDPAPTPIVAQPKPDAAPSQDTATARVGKPYIKAEWCAFECFRVSFAEESIHPSSSEPAMQFAAFDMRGVQCADKCADTIDAQLLSAVGCRDADEHTDRCVEGVTPEIGAEKARFGCEMIEIGLINWCCEKKLLNRKACLTIRKGADAFFAIDKAKRAKLLHSLK